MFIMNDKKRILTKVKSIMMRLLLSKRGWLSLALAYVLWSLFWSPFFLYGLLSNDYDYLAIGTAIFLFFAQPLIPMWLIVPLTAYAILRILDHRVKAI